MSEVIKTVGLVKTFDRGLVKAVDGVSLKVNRGEFVAVMGPSGCGKSTLLALLGGLVRPEAGEAWVVGEDLRRAGDLSFFRQRRVGFVFQFHNLLPHLTVWENVLLPTLGYSKGGAAEKRADALLTRLRIFGLRGRKPVELSGGERQRVAIARALINEPALLLVDEPTGSVDSETGRQILSLFTEIQRERETAFLLVTHNAAVAKVADRILLMKDGKIKSNG